MTNKGQFHYFGPWDDPDAALAKYLDQRADLQAGRKPRESKPREKSAGATVGEVVNRFLTAKKQLGDAQELSPKTFNGSLATGKRIADFFSRNRSVANLRADDFERFRVKLAAYVGPVSPGGGRAAYPNHRQVGL